MNLSYVKEKGLLVFGSLVVSILLLLVSGMGWMRPLYSSVNAVAKPLVFWSGRFAVGVSDVFATISSISSLKSQKNLLTIENAQLRSEIGKLREIEEENEALRKQLGVGISKKWQLKQVRILGLDHLGGAESVIIDVGEDGGVSRDDPLILGSLLIGQVKEVYATTSKVRLVSHRESNIVVVDQQTRAKGIVRGTLEGLVMEDILENEKVKVGDTIVTWADRLPGGLVIGRIKSIERSPTAATKRAFVDSGVSYENLNYAFVVVER